MVSPIRSQICCRHLRLSQPLEWRHNGHDSVSNHWLLNCLLKRLCSRRSKETSKLRVTGLWEGNTPVTGVTEGQERGKCFHLMTSLCYQFEWDCGVSLPHEINFFLWGVWSQLGFRRAVHPTCPLNLANSGRQDSNIMSARTLHHAEKRHYVKRQYFHRANTVNINRSTGQSPHGI